MGETAGNWSAAYNAQDIERVVAFVADDAVIIEGESEASRRPRFREEATSASLCG